MADLLVPPEGGRALRTWLQLLTATERRLAAGGHAAATSTAIAAEAGVAVGTFYTYFPDRDAALAAAFARRLDEIVDEVAAALTTDALLDDGLDALLTQVVGQAVTGYGRHAAVIRAALAQLPSSGLLREVYWTRHERIEQALVTFLTRAQRAGKVRVEDPVVQADALLVIIQGMNHPLLLAHPRTKRTRATRAAIVAALVAMLRP